MASFSDIPYSDIKIFCNHNNTKYKTKDEAYLLTWQSLSSNKQYYAPTSVLDFIIAYNNASINLPTVKYSELDTHLPILSKLFDVSDKIRIVRILSYLHKLENDMIFYSDDVIGNIFSYLKYDLILMVRSVCKNFNSFYQNNKLKLTDLLAKELLPYTPNNFSESEFLYKIINK